MSLTPSATALIADPCFSLVKDYVIDHTGLAYYADKDADLARCLVPHLAARGVGDCGSYLALLRDSGGGPAELDNLIKDLTIGETFFFRHAELFDALRTVVLPDLIDRNLSQRRLRIWSAGCATGAEPYSLSILLRRDLAHRLVGWDVTIVGTDINRDFLADAGRAVFQEWALRSTADEVRRECFTCSGRSFTLLPQYREGVSFQYHNLVSHPFPSLLNNLFAFDLILCRNVMIYFNRAITERVLSGFHQSLVEGGWLLVGHAEPNVQLFKAFRTLTAPGGPVLYQKTAKNAPADGGAEYSILRACPEPFSGKRGWGEGVEGPDTIPPLSPLTPTPLPLSTGREGPVPIATSLDLAIVRAAADRGDWEQALAGCGQLAETDRLNPRVHFYHGLILEQVGRHDDAEQALRRSLYLDRRFTLAHYYLGLLLQRGHQTQQAALAFRNVLGLLAPLDATFVFDDGDGITAAELAKLTRMNLAVLEGS